MMCRYEREEPYFALNLPVKCGSLEDSLRQFVAGEKLEGDNAYFCEKCNKKVQDRNYFVQYFINFLQYIIIFCNIS